VDSALRAHRPARPADDPQRLIEAIRFIRLSSDKNQASPGSTVAEVSDNVHHEDAAPAEESLEALALFVESPVLSEPVNQRADSVEKAAPPAPQPEVAPKDAAPKESSAPAAGHSSGAHSAGFIKVDAGKLDALIDMVGEMVIAQSMVRHNPDLAQLESPLLSKSLMQLARITAEIQKSAMSLRMVQVEGLFQRMARLVRDLCRKSGKEAQLRTFGGDTELDRNIVEQLGDPLMHMVRNSMDHGIENREDRIKAGKNPVATISLHASHQAGNILIEITDDGRGMNRNKILSKAIERGIVPPNAQLTDDEVYAMIFHPGFSTADQVTEISGRGVGMDVVRQHIHSLRGTIEIRTEQGHGTTFRLTLPLTLAIIDGLIAGVGTERYIVPIFMVKEVLRPTPEMLSTIEGTREVVNIRGDVLPVVRLCHRFGIEPLSTEAAETVLIVTESQGREFCLMVDELLGKQEVVIKSLGSAFRNVRGLAGGAILGDGRVGLILDITSLFGRNQS
jgi:two-component system chemotaxis sensor kinase CheA